MVSAALLPKACAGTGQGGAGRGRAEEVPRAWFSTRYLGSGTAQPAQTLLSIVDPNHDMIFQGLLSDKGPK